MVIVDWHLNSLLLRSLYHVRRASLFVLSCRSQVRASQEVLLLMLYLLFYVCVLTWHDFERLHFTLVILITLVITLLNRRVLADVWLVMIDTAQSWMHNLTTYVMVEVFGRLVALMSRTGLS